MQQIKPQTYPQSRPQSRPKARRQQLLIKQVAEETMVYDLDRTRAHCLNPTAAFIWKQCDGQTTVDEIARLLQRGLADHQSSAAEANLELASARDIVSFALAELGERHLLDQNAVANGNGLTRRDLMRKVGVAAAIALPAIWSITAPTAAQAASQLP